MRGPIHGVPTTPERRPASVAARAGLFFALSALAVPACQHFDGTDKPEQAQAERMTVPDAPTPALDGDRVSTPRV